MLGADGARLLGDAPMDETQKAAKFVAQRFTLVFNVPEEISLRSLCTELGYSVPNTDTPYAEKVLADGSFVRVSPRDRVLKTVTVERVGPLEDWGAMRFAVDNIYRDFATVGLIDSYPLA
jgi:hypothetical protein